MAKQPNARKKSVMQDVHPDIADRIEDWTDPEAIEHARKRIVDYAKVAERFAAADLPEEDEDEHDRFDSLETPVISSALSVPSEDLDLLQDLEDTDIGVVETNSMPEDKVWPSASDDLSSAEFDDLEDLLRQTEDKDVPLTSSPAADEIMDVDFDDLDTDLLNDDSDQDNNHALGQEAFGSDKGGTDTDDESFLDDDIFGVPSVPQEPTPFGNRNQNSDSARTVREVSPLDEQDDDLDQMLRNMNAGIQSRAEASDQTPPDHQLPAWMQDDDDDVPDILDAARRRAADQDDDEEEIFGSVPDDLSSTKEEDDRAGRHVEPSPEALNEMLGLTEPKSDTAQTDEQVSEDSAFETVKNASEPTKKKGVFGMFGRKKEKNKSTQTDLEPAALTDDVSEDVNAEVEDTSTTPVKKKGGMKKVAVSILALAAIGGGAYWAADQAGYLGNLAPVQVQNTGQKNLFPSVSETTPDAKTVETPTVPLSVPSDPEKTDAPAEGVGIGPMPNVTPTPPVIESSETVPVIPNEENKAPVVDVPTLPGAETQTDSPSVGTGTPVGPEGPVIPDAAVDALGDLYDVGVSKTQIEEADAAQMSAKINSLTELLEEQSQALESAMNRVKTLEAVMAERDETLATTQGEAETARQSAEEAKNMALAQNKILIEVVGIRDKMQIAEDLIVELSQRTHSLEADDSETQQIRQVNDRITELTRDVGLLARTVLTNGSNLADQKAAQEAADRAYSEAQAAVDANAAQTISNQTQAAPSGSGAVYGNEGRLLTLPETSEIPDTVKVGDKIEGYGEVLDISDLEDGSRLVVMENNSVILPKK